MHDLKAGDDLSQTYNTINSYYASKHATKPNGENGCSKHESRQVSSVTSYVAIPEQSAREAEELKRNSILFPELSQAQIDARILKVCESR